MEEETRPKELFLKFFAETNSIAESLRKINRTRSSFRKWRKTDEEWRKRLFALKKESSKPANRIHEEAKERRKSSLKAIRLQRYSIRRAAYEVGVSLHTVKLWRKN